MSRHGSIALVSLVILYSIFVFYLPVELDTRRNAAQTPSDSDAHVGTQKVLESSIETDFNGEGNDIVTNRFQVKEVISAKHRSTSPFVTQENTDVRSPYYRPRLEDDDEEEKGVSIVDIRTQLKQCDEPNHLPRFIWVRNQKTASTAMYKFLTQLTRQQHLKGSNITHITQGCKRMEMDFDFHPEDLRMHIPYYGCVEDGISSPIRILTMRNPVQRALSVFFHGHTHGPKGVKNPACKSYARHKDLVGFLEHCKDTVDGYYKRMLDPETESLDVALRRLQGFNIMILEDLDFSFEIIKRVLCADQSQWGKRTKLGRVNVNKNRGERLLEPLPVVGLQLLYDYIRDDMILYEEGLRLYHLQREQYVKFVNE